MVNSLFGCFKHYTVTYKIQVSTALLCLYNLVNLVMAILLYSEFNHYYIH